MRTSRWIFYTVLGTALCLLYVYQQTEIVKLGYRIRTAEKVLESCLDRKIALEYTLSSLESPVNIDKTLFLKGDGFEMAKDYKLVKLETSRPVQPVLMARAARSARNTIFKRLAFSTWFGARSAEAKTIK